ncbi:O-methyltransferase [Rossellomorea vietnamensis]|uniref:O-methyltransferase n=2 Tax=Bacillaceae TaxID=186817 RepID=A0A5D4MCE1_9BACI|nr:MULTISPECIES: O-methyltransferase [Bacillaceae]TYR99342.1 O-methyltransferase [Rossellomorea vietnamensis]
MELTERWHAVDEYFSEKLQSKDTLMDLILQKNRDAGLPSIDVSPNQGKFLHLLVKLKGAKKILEIGTLGGYSTVWMAKALPEDGELLSLEFSEKHAAVANENIRSAGLENKVNILTGPAMDTLPTLKDKGYDHFDFIFIDADKSNNPYYFQWAMKLSRPGTVIIVDNVVRKGNIVEKDSEDPNITGTREMFDLLSGDSRIDSTGIQTVGSKGYDGLLFGIVK